MNVDGTKFERLTQIRAEDRVPVWSPDGKVIAFLDVWGRIYLVDREKKNVRLFADTNGGYGGFDWH